jgi:hypothetical protein
MGIYGDSHAGDGQLANAVDSLVMQAGRFDNPVNVIAERRQYIRDVARCGSCGAVGKECERLRGEGRGGCCLGGFFKPCHHIDDRDMVDQLMKEVMAGEVRTVTEAYPPPVQGPKLPSRLWLLSQTEWWYPHRRPAVRIAEMDKPHRWNTARYLERQARSLHDTTLIYMHDAPDDVWASWHSESPLEWLRSQPLMKALDQGMPTRGPKLEALRARAAHWHTCPMRLRPEKRPRGPHDSDPVCVCVIVDGRTVGATNDPKTVTA